MQCWNTIAKLILSIKVTNIAQRIHIVKSRIDQDTNLQDSHSAFGNKWIHTLGMSPGELVHIHKHHYPIHLHLFTLPNGMSGLIYTDLSTYKYFEDQETLRTDVIVDRYTKLCVYSELENKFHVNRNLYSKFYSITFQLKSGITLLDDS